MGSLLNHQQCATSTWSTEYNGTSALTTHQLKPMMSYPVQQKLEFESVQRFRLTLPSKLNMTSAIITLILLLHCSQAAVGGDGVFQEPKILWEPKSGSASLNCNHNMGNLYFQMYWYRQRPGETMRLIVFTMTGGSDPDFGDVDKKKFEAHKSVADSGSLKVKDLEPDDSGIYFCAVRRTGSTGSIAYFGKGTKLTVLARQQKDPIVEILKPSGIETSCKKTVTLVCVAKNFYPDHVSVRWTLEGKEIEKNIATDPYAIQDKDTQLFSISSRLQVPKKEFKPKHKYTCTMKYYYETDKYRNVSSSIIGTEVGGYEPESYVNSAQWMKLAYGVFIAKSGLYGLVVLVYVMRKGSSGK